MTQNQYDYRSGIFLYSEGFLRLMNKISSVIYFIIKILLGITFGSIILFLMFIFSPYIIYGVIMLGVIYLLLII